MNSFLKSITLSAILATQACSKVVRQSYQETPSTMELDPPGELSYEVEGSRLIVHGKHEDHTRSKIGNYRHPFLHAPKEIKHIEYPDSHTYSVKLTARSVPKKAKNPKGIIT